jgi:hypothetical protein
MAKTQHSVEYALLRTIAAAAQTSCSVRWGQTRRHWGRVLSATASVPRRSISVTTPQRVFCVRRIFTVWVTMCEDYARIRAPQSAQKRPKSVPVRRRRTAPSEKHIVFPASQTTFAQTAKSTRVLHSPHHPQRLYPTPTVCVSRGIFARQRQPLPGSVCSAPLAIFAMGPTRPRRARTSLVAPHRHTAVSALQKQITSAKCVKTSLHRARWRFSSANSTMSANGSAKTVFFIFKQTPFNRCNCPTRRRLPTEPVHSVRPQSVHWEPSTAAAPAARSSPTRAVRHAKRQRMQSTSKTPCASLRATSASGAPRARGCVVRTVQSTTAKLGSVSVSPGGSRWRLRACSNDVFLDPSPFFHRA